MSLAAFGMIGGLLAVTNQQLRLMIVSMTHAFSILKITFGSNFLMQNVECPFILKKKTHQNQQQRLNMHI